MTVAVSDESLGLTEPLDLDDVKWAFRALGCLVSDPSSWANDESLYLKINTPTGLAIDLFDDRSAIVDSDCDVLFPDSVEWPVLRLLMRLIGAPEDACNSHS